jgi:hypothetical protein
MGMTREQIEAMSDNDVALFLVEKIVGRVFKNEEERQVWAAMRTWRPECSLDHAMEAAEKVGLDLEIASYFRNKKHLAKCVSPERYFLWYEASTPALAVCNAVIAVHEASIK